MSDWIRQTFARTVAVRDCQTQTISPAAENGNNHQREPEASVTTGVKEGKEDQNLPNSNDTNKDRQEGETPLNSTSESGTGQIPGERQQKIEGQADQELAAENAYNHQKEPEASVTKDRKEDMPLRNSSDSNQDRQKVEKPWGTRQMLGKKQRKIEEQGEIRRQRRVNPGRDPNAPDDPTANIKRVAKYAFGVAFIAVGIFVVLGSTGGGAVAAPVAIARAASAGSAYAGAGAGLGFGGAASAGGSVWAASAGAAAGLGFGGAAAITGLYAAGEVTVGAVRYITRRKYRGPTKDADTQTDLDKSD